MVSVFTFRNSSSSPKVITHIDAPVQDDFIPFSNASSVTVYEQTGDVYAHTFLVTTLIEKGYVFATDADEWFILMSDGEYLRIVCFRANRLSGDAVGNNIVAVRLDGVADRPEGVWASKVVNYTLGYSGIEESVANALGPNTQLGPLG